jgi:hypothetical protein
MSSPPPFKDFVSHIHEEAPLAVAIKDGLEDAFGSRVIVFVSSDPRDNPGGDKWLDKIQREIKDPQTRLVISVISPISLHRLWVLVELGAAWARDINVFPLCHSGITPADLPRPLQDFGGATVERGDAAVRLLGAAEQAVGLSVRSTTWPRDLFLAEMQDAVTKISTTAGTSAPAAAAPAAPGPDLPSDQVGILQFLARIENSGVEDVTCREAGPQLGMPISTFKHHVTELMRLGFAQDSIYAGDYHYSITADGAGWLVKRGLMPDD